MIEGITLGKSGSGVWCHSEVGSCEGRRFLGTESKRNILFGCVCSNIRGFRGRLGACFDYCCAKIDGYRIKVHKRPISRRNIGLVV